MELVEELAFGIVQDHRECQKKRLQRTFVSGSDAANGKVNRSKKPKTSQTEEDENRCDKYHSNAQERFTSYTEKKNGKKVMIQV